MVNIIRTSALCYIDTWETWMKDKLTVQLIGNFDGERQTYYKEMFFPVIEGGGAYFLAGHLNKVTSELKVRGIPYVLGDARTPSPAAYEIDWTYADVAFRGNQRDTLVKITENDKGIIKCCTGYGKSFLIRTLCSMYPNAKILVVTKAAEVVKSLYNEITTVTGKGVVGILKGSSPVTEEHKRIQVCTTRSLLRSHIKDCDILFFDEVHNCGDNQVYEMLVQHCGHARMFGFTASLYRGDRAIPLIHGLFGEVISQFTYSQGVESGMVTPMKALMLEYKCPFIQVTGNLSVDKKLSYWHNRCRNQLVADVCSTVPKNEQLMITVETLEHLILLKQLPALRDYPYVHYGSSGSIYENKVVPWDVDHIAETVVVKHKRTASVCHLQPCVDNDTLYFKEVKGTLIVSPQQLFMDYTMLDGSKCGYIIKQPRSVKGISALDYKLTDKDKNKVLSDFSSGKIKRLIATTVIKEGVNFPSLEWIFRAEGGVSEVYNTQFNGRGSRLSEGKKVCRILHPMDRFNPWVLQRAESCKKFYISQRWLDS